MSPQHDEFIQLDRTFHDLVTSDEGGDDVEMRRLFGTKAPIRWPELLQEARVILLSEAGSGKTEEIRHVTRQLRADGKPAFFVRIEHVVQDFESSFEEGSLDEFEAWIASGAEGWLLLDSVDEARLRDPKDFERAVRKLGVKLRPVLQSAHIVITGRSDAWRPKTDLLLCMSSLAWVPPTTTADTAALSEPNVATVETRGPPRESFRVVALDDLHGQQLDRFAMAKGVNDLKAFRTSIDKAEAWSFTTRPLDLSETIDFWVAEKRIGSRLELMRSSIAKRLEERDQDRSEARPITKAKAREGARLVAAAVTLAQASAIRVPDGQQNSRGLAIKEVLTDWNDNDCAALLSRPIFDEGIYGTVRFHHRSVREYLTAEWLHSLIVDEGSRAKIEALFFRRQYGIDVIVPTMRPILPWLAILDTRILARLVRLAPEVLFEGGDPSQLPLETRQTILRQVCEQVAQPAHGRSMMDYAAVQRFTNPDLAADIGALLDQYAGDDDIMWFLLRMVWQGDIKVLANKAKHFAIHSRGQYARIAAIRAVAAVGAPLDLAEVRAAFLTEGPPLRREWVAEFVSSLPHGAEDIAWLLAVLERAPPKERFRADSLSDALIQFVAELPLDRLVELIGGIRELLKREPVIERRHCEISDHHRWLAPIAAQILARLIGAHHAGALAEPTLSVLRLLPIAEDYGELRDVRKDLPALVHAWPALNHALFWHCVAEERMQRQRVKGERLIDHWHVSILGALWEFRANAFDAICGDIEHRPLLDDRLVALTLAFQLYRHNGRLRPWRERLKRLVAGEAQLEVKLAALLNPPAEGRSNWRRQEAAWQRRAARQKARQTRELERAKVLLTQRIATLRNPGRAELINSDQHYLHEQMRVVDGGNNRWTEGNWESLIPVFGEAVARAFRDGAVAYWRQGRPELRSEGAAANSTPFSAIFGLTGLAIESREAPRWPEGLSAQDAERATRYALCELNGFPTWLPRLHQAFPDEVTGVILGEIAHELASETADSESHYVLYDTSWHGQWLWDQIAPRLISAVRAKRPNAHNLGYLLAIIQGSSIHEATIARIAAQKARATRNLTFSAIWFAVWVGADPDAAIPALAARLAGLNDPAGQTLLAMRFIVELLGGRSQKGRTRQAYRTVEHMKTLYLLMLRYIREKEDIQRAGKGVYSPGIRDNAQDARNALFAFIRETPGKDAFLALVEMARAHPEEDSRHWMNLHAKTKAAIDTDIAAWTPTQVRDFNDHLIRTPSNHRELWHLAVDRLEALKHDLEDGDASIASLLQVVEQETEFRKFIGGWCRDRSGARYNIPQEEELADAKRPDLRFLGVGFDGPVPAELKVADKLTGPQLFERLEAQLCGDYLRDVRSSRGIFVLIYLGTKTYWELPGGGRVESIDALVQALQAHWSQISSHFPNIEDIAFVGVDLTRRGGDPRTAKSRSAQRSP